MVINMMHKIQKNLCNQCKQDTVKYHVFSGDVLCESCFHSYIVNQVQRAISKWKMLEHSDRIAVAFSGGKDSTALLALLIEIQNRFPELELIAITLEEGVNEARDRKHTLRTATQLLGVEHVSASYQGYYGVTLDEIHNRAQELSSPLSTCAYCGVLRRQGLNKLAREINADKLALGHNLDDEIQSMFMNLLRGDLKRLSRLRPTLKGENGWLVPRIKPLYTLLESEITEFVQILRVPYYKCPCIYGEQSIRTEIRHWLNRTEAQHHGTKQNLLAIFEKIINKLNREESSLILKCHKCGEPTSRELCSTCEYLRKLFT